MTNDTLSITTNEEPPPPAYTVLPPDPLRSAHFQPPPHFGPTPLTSHLPYAYYDSPDSADGRARRRFVEGLICGIGVWVVFVVIVFTRDKY